MFVTLTCPSYGRVDDDGTPVDPATYDYDRAARDALHFAALFDRFIQNLRRYLGYDVQYFAAVEPQRRLAPHVHIAIRGTIARAELRRVLAATYHQVWWPDAATVRIDGDQLPVWDEARPATTSTRPPGKCCRPGTRRWMPSAPTTSRCTWPGSGTGSTPRASSPGPRTPRRCIGYLTKYLTKHRRLPPGRHRRRSGSTPTGWPRRCGIEPCSPRCANWLRYGIQPKNARPGLAPGRCKGKAHRRRTPRLRRAPRPGLPQVVRQDPGRSPRRPQGLAPGHPRCPGNRPGPVRLGTRRPRRPGPHGPRPAAAARRRRPRSMASSTE